MRKFLTSPGTKNAFENKIFDPKSGDGGEQEKKGNKNRHKKNTLTGTRITTNEQPEVQHTKYIINFRIDVINVIMARNSRERGTQKKLCLNRKSI